MAKTATTHTADSDSLVQQYHEPQFQQGFTRPAAGDSVLPREMQLDSLVALERPQNADAHQAAHSPLHDMGSMGLLLLSSFLVITSYRTGYKYIENLFHYMFSVKRRESLFDDHTVSETRIMFVMLFNTWVMEGLLLYYAVGNVRPALVAHLQSSVFLHVAMFTAVAAAFHFLQVLAYRVLGWVFAEPVETRLWLSGFNSTQATLGLLLFPVVVVTLVAPSTAKTTLILALSLYFLARLVFIYKGFRIFFGEFRSSIHFLLYLCSVEIVPPLSIFAGTIFLCNVV